MIRAKGNALEYYDTLNNQANSVAIVVMGRSETSTKLDLLCNSNDPIKLIKGLNDKVPQAKQLTENAVNHIVYLVTSGQTNMDNLLW